MNNGFCALPEIRHVGDDSFCCVLGDNILVQVACAVVIAVAFGVSSYSTGRALTAAGAAAVTPNFSSNAFTNSESSMRVSSLNVIGFAARLLARRARISALAVTTAAIVPLLPGRKAYEGISLIVTQPDGLGFSAGLPTLAEAFGLGLGLAAGVSLGTYLAALLLARRHGSEGIGIGRGR